MIQFNKIGTIFFLSFLFITIFKVFNSFVHFVHIKKRKHHLGVSQNNKLWLAENDREKIHEEKTAKCTSMEGYL